MIEMFIAKTALGTSRCYWNVVIVCMMDQTRAALEIFGDADLFLCCLGGLPESS
jgi:hypothetical protein